MLRPWKVGLTNRIDPALRTPLYLQIVHALIREIESGRLAPGTYLPSSREMATTLGVNRKTVVLAYEDLMAQGWLNSEGTRGTVVSRAITERGKGAAKPTPQEAPFPERPSYDFLPPPARALALPESAATKIDEGAPDGRLFPQEILSRAYRSAIKRAARDNRLAYRDPRGTPMLRAGVAEMLRSERGLAVSADNICITRGSQHALFLAARALIRPGDVVLVEALTHEPAFAVFAACGAKTVPVALDENGVDVADVERACRKHRVRAIFLTPHHQFPTTVALRPERRLRLLELARQFNFAVIEDDYDHEFHFESQPLLPMASYAPSHVVYLGSLSKLLLPALRIGYLVAPAAYIDAIAHGVSLTDGMGNTVTEDAVAELITEGELRRHARKVGQVYAARRDAFAQAMAAELGDRIDYRMPDGGLAFWVNFRDSAVLRRAEANAARHGLRFASSESFRAAPDAPHGLRLGFASLTETEAQAALKRLGLAARDQAE
jgi:GntR family transcriptional regulator/MocR family aminotransferase